MDALRNLEVWTRSSRLCVVVYRSTETCSNWSFRDQVTRSALSVPSNIAEGYERDSPRETVRFLKIAKGSCGELWTQIHIGMQAGFIDSSIAGTLAAEVEELSRMLQGLIGHYQRKGLS
jgi:four helix bundle protein